MNYNWPQIVRVDPTSEENLPGITSLTEELKKWEWNFGKTPKFHLTAMRHFKFGRLAVEMKVNKGRIENCCFLLDGTTEKLFELQSSIIGSRLGRGDMKQQISESQEFGSNSVDIVQWLDSLL
ncbi:Lipoyltransferase 1, mitochondrial [Geodia barretti]|uniref:lipoate--protein ligase n=1 Tax=Geodia barretti TaxID=519541 RepID=A0AA35RQL8_GEOBA|nr:Lipoyltransferase 1, mitochondrial [Geodia barretti]